MGRSRWAWVRSSSVEKRDVAGRGLSPGLARCILRGVPPRRGPAARGRLRRGRIVLLRPALAFLFGGEHLARFGIVRRCRCPGSRVHLSGLDEWAFGLVELACRRIVALALEVVLARALRLSSVRRRMLVRMLLPFHEVPPDCGCN